MIRWNKNSAGEGKRTIILQTDRLLLRRMDISDYPAICHILKDPQVMYAYAHGFSDREVRLWMENQFRRYREDGVGLWAVELKDGGEVIGQCGITRQQWNGTDIWEVGYLFRKEYWHRGYATEAAKGCCAYGFHEKNMDTLYAVIRDTNSPSQNVALRCGMKPVGTMVKHYYHMDMPHIVFSIEKKATPSMGD